MKSLVGPGGLAFACAGTLSLIGSHAWGHVAFENIATGDTLEAGSVVELTWVDVIPHDTIAYHLEFTAGEDAEPARVVSDMPSSQHSYSWQVPAVACTDCPLTVIQDNRNSSNYTGTARINIVTDPADTPGVEGAADSTGGAPGSTGASEPGTAAGTSQMSEASSDEGCSLVPGRPTSHAAGSWAVLLIAWGVLYRRGLRRS